MFSIAGFNSKSKGIALFFVYRNRDKLFVVGGENNTKGDKNESDY
jgi:hypothetical protein